jgi:hypothetical protein
VNWSVLLKQSGRRNRLTHLAGRGNRLTHISMLGSLVEARLSMSYESVLHDGVPLFSNGPSVAFLLYQDERRSAVHLQWHLDAAKEWRTARNHDSIMS